MASEEDLSMYLHPGEFVDSGDPAVIEFARQRFLSTATDTENAIKLYYAVRDGFRYDPYRIDLRRSGLKASSLVKRDSGYCIEKACLLAAVGRVAGIPSRLGFANVRNHIGTQRLEQILRSHTLVFHGYAEFFLEGKWVKATPAFNQQLCERLNVAPLEFDGKTDSLFQQYDAGGNLYMEYLHDYGPFSDVPYDLLIGELKKYYPHLFEMGPVDRDGYLFVF